MILTPGKKSQLNLPSDCAQIRRRRPAGQAGRERSGGFAGVSLELGRWTAPKRVGPGRSVAHTCNNLHLLRQPFTATAWGIQATARDRLPVESSEPQVPRQGDKRLGLGRTGSRAPQHVRSFKLRKAATQRLRLSTEGAMWRASGGSKRERRGPTTPPRRQRQSGARPRLAA